MTEPQVAQETRRALGGRAAPRFRRLAGNRLPGSDWMSTLIAYPATRSRRHRGRSGCGSVWLEED
jgi:hypothetical protein